MIDDGDEIHSPATASPPSPTTINVPAPAPASPPDENCKALIVPLQLPKTVTSHAGGRSGGGGREDCWSEGATGVLIDAWGERYLELSRGNLKQKHWKEVAEIVSSREDYTKSAKTDIQCKNRIDTVKKKYKVEKAKIATGGGPSKWAFFERLDNLIGPSTKVAASGGDGGRPVALFSNIPLGIPTGIRSSKHHPHRGRGSVSDDGRNKVGRNLNQNQNVRMLIRKRNRGVMESEEEDEEEEEEEEEEVQVEGELYSDDSLPPVVEKTARRGAGVMGKARKGWGSSARLLEQAMLNFGEAYERAESAKLQQIMEMEKTRMKFVKELELQRMQFFMKTQMEISQLRHGRRGSNAGQHHLHRNHPGNNINSNSNNSFSDN